MTVKQLLKNYRYFPQDIARHEYLLQDVAAAERMNRNASAETKQTFKSIKAYYRQQIRRYNSMAADTLQAMESINDSTTRDIITAVYIDGMSIDKTAEIFFYDPHTITRKVRSACMELETAGTLDKWTKNF